MLLALAILLSACLPAAPALPAPPFFPPPASPTEEMPPGILVVAPALEEMETLPIQSDPILEALLLEALPALEPAEGPPPPELPAPEVAPPIALPAPDSPYASLTIAHLAGRSYGGGELQVRQLLSHEPGFTRYLFSYPSDGLAVYGFMNVPNQAPGPYPVVIALHGYVDPAIYRTLDYTTRYADILAQAGYLVLHPNLRGYAPSDDGPNLFRVGMAVDVLNLVALVKEQAGLPGPLESARPDALGLWGHSMGGGISLRVLTISPDIRAAVLYAAMSGDEKQNFEAIREWSGDQRGHAELTVPEAELLAISPIYFLDRVRALVSIHHGEGDAMVPLEWSQDLCWRLSDLGKPVECVTYPGQPHTFDASGETYFMQRVIEFYDRELK